MEIFQEIWSTLRQNKLRTVLTGFAVSWGLFMLIGLLGAGNGLLNALKSNSGDIMANSMIIWPGQRSIPYEGRQKWSSIIFKEDDVEYMKGSSFSNVIDDVAGTIYYSDTLSYANNSVPVSVNGNGPLAKDIDNLKIYAGRFLNKKDMDEYRKSVVIDNSLAEDLIGGTRDCNRMVGRYVNLGHIAFRVVGIIEKDEMSGSSSVYIPLTTAGKLRAKGNHLDQISLSFHGLDTEADNEVFESSLRRSMNYRHTAAPEDRSTIYIWNRMTQNLSMSSAVTIINMALWILGIFTLLSGIVGVSNIMLITVKERIHEFGIRKALGATPWGIMKLIVVESVCITAFFGYIGMLLGLVANYVMDITIAGHPVDIGITQVYMFKDPVVGIGVAVEATILMVVAGTLAGLIPAMKAAKVRPIEALGKE